MNQLLNLISIQFKEFFREPGILFWSMLFPVLMAGGLGVAFSGSGELIRHVALIENAEAQHPDLRQFVGDKTQTDADGDLVYRRDLEHPELGTTNYYLHPVNWEQAELMLKRGEASLIVTEGEELSYHFDPVNPEAQLTYLQLDAAIKNGEAAFKQGSIQPLTQVGTRYVDFLVPGLLAMGIMMSCMWGISYSLIDKRSKKLLRRMVATPMSKTAFLFSHFVSRMSLGVIETSLLVGVSYLVFDISIQGNFFALLAMFIAGNMAFTGIAILVSSKTGNPQIGNGLINAVVMPMMIMSGIFFSYHSFPDAMIPVIEKFPLTMLADSVRSIFIEGAGFAEVWIPLVSLMGLGVVTFFFGQRMYKWY